MTDRTGLGTRSIPCLDRSSPARTIHHSDDGLILPSPSDVMPMATSQ